jgi:hypothetical protein
MFDRYHINFVEKMVVGPLFNEKSLTEHDGLLRSYPSAKVDAAWEALTDVGVVVITGEEVAGLGKDPAKTVKAPEEWGMFPENGHGPY